MKIVVYCFLSILSNNVVLSNSMDCHFYQKWTGDDPAATKIHNFHVLEGTKASVLFTWVKFNRLFPFKKEIYWSDLVIEPKVAKLSSPCVVVHIHKPNYYTKYPQYDWKDFYMFNYYLGKSDAMFIFWFRTSFHMFYLFWGEYPCIFKAIRWDGRIYNYVRGSNQFIRSRLDVDILRLYSNRHVLKVRMVTTG